MVLEAAYLKSCRKVSIVGGGGGCENTRVFVDELIQVFIQVNTKISRDKIGANQMDLKKKRVKKCKRIT